MNGAKLRAMLREQGPRFLAEAGVNFILPIIIYDALKPGWGDVGALLWSSMPPIVWSVVEFVRHRRLDAVSLLVLGGIVLSLLAFFGGGSARFLQLREKLVTVLIGFVFLGSAAIGRPLIYELSRAALQRKSAAELAEFEALRSKAGFRRSMTVMTLVWGFGLVAEAALSAVLVFRLSIHDYLVVAPVLGYAATGGLSLWTFWYVRRAKRRRREAEAAASPVSQAAA